MPSSGLYGHTQMAYMCVRVRVCVRVTHTHKSKYLKNTFSKKSFPYYHT